MAEDRIPTEMLVSAQRRIAAAQGVPIFVLQKGDPASGTLLLKINYLDGNVHLLSQTRIDDELVWTYALGPEPLSEADADSYVRGRLDDDPDLWALEIEDREGRLWFPGKIVDF